MGQKQVDGEIQRGQSIGIIAEEAGGARQERAADTRRKMLWRYCLAAEILLSLPHVGWQRQMVLLSRTFVTFQNANSQNIWVWKDQFTSFFPHKLLIDWKRLAYEGSVTEKRHNAQLHNTPFTCDQGLRAIETMTRLKSQDRQHNSLHPHVHLNNLNCLFDKSCRCQLLTPLSLRHIKLRLPTDCSCTPRGHLKHCAPSS